MSAAPMTTPTATDPGASPVSAIDISLPASAAQQRVASAMRVACERIAPLWPLGSFVAVNPYLGLANMRFGAAAELLASAAGASTTMPAAFYLDAIDQGRITKRDLAAALAVHQLPVDDVAGFVHKVRAAPPDRETVAARVPSVAGVAAALTRRDWVRLSTDRVSAWAAVYFDEGQASWSSADRNRPLFAAWKEEASIDRTPEVMGLAGFRAAVRSLPDDPAAAATRVLAALAIPDDSLELYLHALLLRVGGWSAHAARIVWDNHLRGDDDDDTVQQLLGVLLAWELAVLQSPAHPGVPGAWQEAKAQFHPADDARIGGALEQLLVLQTAFDRSEQHRIIEQLSSARAESGSRHGRPRAQAVFCIDVRSEVFRRHLEAVADDVATVGFAGFFGFAIEYLPIAHDRGEAQCPVLLNPGHTVAETVSDEFRHGEAVERRRLKHHVERAWKSFKMGAISCFSFVGPVGLLYLPKLFTDAYGRTRPVKRPEDEGLSGWAAHTKGPSLDPVGAMADTGVPRNARIQLAEGALRAMSLTDGFAPLVLIVGHGATTVNNPYGTGLDCGACGGHTGEANARVAAAILNDSHVRAALAVRGITIPDDTWFLAGQHNTTTDEITLYDQAAVPAGHAGLLQDLTGHLVDAGRRSRRERANRLGITRERSIDAAVIGRSRDWAQVRPEWGLAGCRAFIVAPRSRTQHLNLQGRSFLHSYDWRQDEGFAVLELIMSAPMVVASWINLQYYASTVENRLFGSGNKTLHNVVGRIGVLEGNAGDLRVGLSWQSVHDGQVLQHEPLRLNVIIEAPIDAMNNVLAAHPDVRDLCDNRWLQLLAMDDAGTVSHRYVGAAHWEPVVPEAPSAQTCRQ